MFEKEDLSQVESRKVLSSDKSRLHRDFLWMLLPYLSSKADVSILVVDSRVGEFEAGFDAGGQTREHAILARSLGVGQLVVAVNKMDSVSLQLTCQSEHAQHQTYCSEVLQ